MLETLGPSLFSSQEAAFPRDRLAEQGLLAAAVTESIETAPPHRRCWAARPTRPARPSMRRPATCPRRWRTPVRATAAGGGQRRRARQLPVSPARPAIHGAG